MTPSTAAPAVTAVLAATPYPWPYHGVLDPSRLALVACLDRRWRVEGAPSDASDAQLGELARGLRALGALVVAVTATPGRRGGRVELDHGAKGRVDAAFGTATDTPVEAAVVIGAGGTSAFYASPLDDLLRAARRPDLLIAGWGLEGPVHSTLRAANDRGYECLLVPDASSPLEPALVHGACEMVRFSGGIFGAVSDTASVLAALAGDHLQRST